MTCNIVEDLRYQGYSFSSNKVVNLSTQQTVADMAIKDYVWGIELREFPYRPKVGPAPLVPSTFSSISATWPVSELQRFEAMKVLEVALQRQQKAFEFFTSAEEAWLKKNWGNESYFLRAHGLNITKEEDRRKDRTILRALMADDND